MKKIIALTFMLLLGGGLLTGCNTMEGFGEDVENAGEEIEEEAS
ncbi:Predicted small secreted protein [Modicisalibacter muralis]|uniref:Predicted small secreted protein n=1 Tax=Modicisalibacter muralis TaxID=119000 RepID=A0A1G9JYV3_9GAMM|nr:entericidin A/B family lipoprotein [Halomonas muralis]SDL42830.1 Predicted small secreted protein [Halomonas muralis]